MYWFNLLSLFLGLIAIGLPTYLFIYKKRKYQNPHLTVFISMACTLASLFFQTIYTRYLVQSNDWAALLDTQGVVVLVSAVLIILVVLLNGLLVFNYQSSMVKR